MRFRRKTKAKIPGGAKDWTEVLPEPFRGNPFVIVVSVPQKAKTRIATTPQGFRVGLLETSRGVRGLQVIGAGGNYLDHQEVIEKQHRIQMADPSFIGPLLRMPNSLLNDDRLPLIFLRDRIGEPYLNLKHYLFHTSQGDDDRRVN